MDKSQLMESIKLRSQIKQNIEDFSKLVGDLQKIEHETYFRNVKLDFLQEIYNHYNEKYILNADGDIFYVTERKQEDKDCIVYKGNRILWNMSTSKEQYTIYEYICYDNDGEYDYTDYEVELIK